MSNYIFEYSKNKHEIEVSLSKKPKNSEGVKTFKLSNDTKKEIQFS
jgi:hypothetical protein